MIGTEEKRLHCAQDGQNDGRIKSETFQEILAEWAII